MKRKIELLAPAKNVECGLEAVRHGADAVYIGGPNFGARFSASNSLEDLKRLCDYAHTFGVRIYVTLNTILYENELEQAKKLIEDLYRIGVDALIVQDLALLEMDLPPIPLHASTQMDNCTPEKVKFLEEAGFQQVVLARELSLDHIHAIRQATNVPLEAFVHGALCVSFSGRCYASEYCFKRSANRGECAQFCRLAFDLVDANNRVIEHDKHLLSLRDMNRSEYIEEMLDAGVSSFKIEGRLKDVGFVKNITAFYRRKIDEIIERRNQEFERSSYGTTQLRFTPHPEKTFNRGFTDYYLHGRHEGTHNFNTPKAIGEYIGKITQRKDRSIILQPIEKKELVAGDGLCYLSAQGKLEGFRVNRVVKTDSGQMEVFPNERLSTKTAVPAIPIGTVMYRNQDAAFDKLMARPSAERTLFVDMTLSECPTGYALTLQDETGRTHTMAFDYAHQKALTPQQAPIERQLARLGDTPFVARNITIETENFIPASLLGEWRRTAVEQLLQKPCRPRELRKPSSPPLTTSSPIHLDYTANVSNQLARQFYLKAGAKTVAPAFEIEVPKNGVLMFCRHCLRYAYGCCPTFQKGEMRWKEPLALHLPDGRRFPLAFDCKNCQMLVMAPKG